MITTSALLKNVTNAILYLIVGACWVVIGLLTNNGNFSFRNDVAVNIHSPAGVFARIGWSHVWDHQFVAAAVGAGRDDGDAVRIRLRHDLFVVAVANKPDRIDLEHILHVFARNSVSI